MKYITGILIGVAVTTLIVFLVVYQRNNSDSIENVFPTVGSSSTPSAFAVPTQTSLSTATPIGQGVGTGEITGKLCYPSQFLPAGSIEAKNTLNDTLVSQNYAGTENGAGSTYSIAVPAGTYILRYKAGEIYGYHTDVCATGLETSCAQENARQHKQVIVTSGKTVSGIDLCDFYYSESTEPAF